MYISSIIEPEVSRQLGRIGSDQLPLLAQVLVVHVPRQAVLEPDKRYRVSQKKVSDKIFPQRLPNGRGLRTNFQLNCEASLKTWSFPQKVAGRPLASDQVSGDKVCGWSVVNVRWEVVEEKFYQRLFSGTPCR